ncbi:MAG: hypothetical protein MJ252_02100 [archaeon]|nr:hypothetical protein [archaeon]
MIKNSVKAKATIFERLFKDAELKRVSQKRPCHFGNKSPSMAELKPSFKPMISRNKSKGTNGTNDSLRPKNYGEYLYNKGKADLEKKRTKLMADHNKREADKMNECTFKPNTTEYNPEMFENELIINQNQNEEDNPPHVVISRPKTPMPKAERLKIEYSQIYTFKPKINEYYPSNKIDMTFNQRQKFYENEYKKNREKKKQFSVDNHKIKAPFQPNLISKQYPKRKQSMNSNEEGKNVFDKNYDYANIYENKKKDLKLKYNNSVKSNLAMKTKNNSDKLMEDIYKDMFSKLFKELDSDQDNQITPLTICLKRTDPKILKIIEPLLNEMKEDNQSLDSDEFISAMTRLYYELPNDDKHTLINKYRTKKIIGKHSISKGNDFNLNLRKINKNETNLMNTFLGINQTKPKIIQEKSKGQLVFRHKPEININSNILAKRHDTKMERLYDNYMKTKMKNEVTKNQYFRSNPFDNLNDYNRQFTKFSDCTFDNYLKSLN